MKIDFDQVFNDLDGVSIKRMVATEDDERAPDTKMLLAWVSTQSLLALDQGIDETEKIKRHLLAVKVHAGGIIELKIEEVAKITQLIGKYQPTIIVGLAQDMFEEACDDVGRSDT